MRVLEDSTPFYVGHIRGIFAEGRRGAEWFRIMPAPTPRCPSLFSACRHKVRAKWNRVVDIKCKLPWPHKISSFLPLSFKKVLLTVNSPCCY